MHTPYHRTHPMSVPASKSLALNFHGRIIDHLGIQMYQSPVAAVAELVSNCWDADAEHVWIELPDRTGPGATLVVRDDGHGMTFAECDDRFLNAGYDKRKGDPSAKSRDKKRPVLGRKGIGKFAGFGIAKRLVIETVSKSNGERTVFEMNLDIIRGDGSTYAGNSIPIAVKEYESPDPARAANHGTKITLHELTMRRRPNAGQFADSMARRFLLHQEADDFEVLVDQTPIPHDPDLAHVQFTFPKDYEDDEKPAGLAVEDGWALEELGSTGLIRWRFRFYEEPIQEDDLKGVAVFAEGKLAQRPFAFELKGGLHAQNGLEYLAGQVDASYIDHLSEDLISTERQRVNWEHDAAAPLLEWGQDRIKQLLRLWRERRNVEKVRMLQDRLEPFHDRLSRLQSYERRTVEPALKKLASMERLPKDRFRDVAMAILNAWDSGRLRNMIASIADADDLDAARMLEILGEADVLTALNLAEIIKAKKEVISTLESLVEDRELENSIRDYIAQHPWMLDPRWETYQVERGLGNITTDIGSKVKLHEDGAANKRLDLVLSSNSQLLVVEFMRPGLKVDFDHIGRFQRYVVTLRQHVKANSGLGFSHVEGLLVADKLTKDPVALEFLASLQKDGMDALDWQTLLSRAKKRWSEFMDVVVARAPEDERLSELAAGDGSSVSLEEPEDK